MKTAIKLTSLKALNLIANPEKVSSDKWSNFLKEKGHTNDTFSYLPENLKTDLKFSFAKKHS